MRGVVEEQQYHLCMCASVPADCHGEWYGDMGSTEDPAELPTHMAIVDNICCVLQCYYGPYSSQCTA